MKPAAPKRQSLIALADSWQWSGYYVCGQCNGKGCEWCAYKGRVTSEQRDQVREIIARERKR